MSALNKFRFFVLSIFLVVQMTTGKILLLMDEGTEAWTASFLEGITEYGSATGNSFDVQAVPYKNESNWDQVCQSIASGVTIVLDVTKKMGNPDTQPKTFFTSKSIPYYQVELPFDIMLKGMDGMLQANNGSNGFLIFNSAMDVNRGIHVILGSTLIRYAFLNAETQRALIIEKFDYRIPSAVVQIGSEDNFENFIASNNQVVRNRTDWIFLFDWFYQQPPGLNVSFPYYHGFYDTTSCCSLEIQNSRCSPSNCNGNPTLSYLKKLAYKVAESLQTTDPQKSRVVKLNCRDGDGTQGSEDFKQTLTNDLQQRSDAVYAVENDQIKFLLPFRFQLMDSPKTNKTNPVGQYSSANGFSMDSSFTFPHRLPYYRIGIVDYPPWTYKDENGKWTGYCIDLAEGIAQKMNFTYDLVESKRFGDRVPPNGRWDGLTGDLIHGKVDIAVAAYIMTSEREEFVDFVSPYYEQSGLIITMKRPVVKNSLFKFMTVLRTEVWLSIAGATIATAFMLWFLDKFSPYSAQNNPHKYKSFRKFTLKESFWFALTSFTPQGGGEPPKALSGRTLVAAYWIFVVLMLATFTANLAAFLTVERMQSPIRNLEHLASQSSVKYSVVNSSTAMTFFNNMAHAEEILYQMWRNLTLKAPSSAKEYIVWEYPIREMYIHINSVIQSTGPVNTTEEGYARAENDQYFAFIHDAAQTRYEVFKNCNLTLIGEPFAEAPYALAVAQGNPLQDDVSMAILQLQTERFFETLSAKYWSSSCPSLGEGESDGISLESLGGVFIATIIGLGIAFISLAFEIFSTARNRRKAQIAEANMIKPKFVGPLDFYGTTNPLKLNSQVSHKADVFRRTGFLPEVMN